MIVDGATHQGETIRLGEIDKAVLRQDDVNSMSKTSIMTLRIPIDVRRDLERLAAQLGYKPAQLGSRLVEEGLRRRHFPQIELRETAAGRVAYLKGKRLAAYWVVQRVRKGKSTEQIARDLDIPPAQVTAAIAYTEAFPDEVQLDIEEAEANRHWLEVQESAWSTGHPAQKHAVRRPT